MTGAGPDAGPLAGIKVVDFTHIVAGPLCTQLLADGGAEIVKIEPPQGEWARNRGPRVPAPGGGAVSSYFTALNRGKQSVALDLKTRAGQDVARRLVADADVCIWNFLEGTMERLGLGLDVLRRDHPRLVTVAISLLGDAAAHGLPTRPGLAIVAEAESGHTAMHRDAHGAPVRGDLPMGDAATGMAAYGALVTALFERERTGHGRHLVVSMVRSLLALNATGITGEQLKPPGVELRDVGTAAYGLFPARDGHVTIGVNSDRLFRRLAQVIGRPELADDPRFAGFAERDARYQEVNELVASWTAPRSRRHILAELERGGIPAGVVQTPADVLGDPTFRALGYFTTVDDGFGRSIDAAACPFGWSHAHPAIPRVGEHTGSVLGTWLGMSDSDVAALAAEGAFGPRG